jgi:undecaprenyl-diphosphatase
VKRTYLYALLAISLLGYAALAVLAHAYQWTGFDLSTTLLFQGWRSGPLDTVMTVISWPGYFPEFIPFFVVLMVVMYRMKLKVEAIFLSIAELGVGAMGFIVKPIVHRLRPPTSLVWVNDKLTADPYSFTAGHVHTFVVIFGFIIFLAATRIPGWTWQKIVLVFGSLAILLVMGFSRIYLGDHWASDVVGGYCAGGIWLGLGLLAYLWQRDRAAGATRRPSPARAKHAT